MTPDTLKKLKEKLPRGYAKKIANKLNISESTVRKVINGQRNNFNVIVVALELAKETLQQEKKVLKEIESL